MAKTSKPKRDPDAVARFVERFAMTVSDSGIPRMASRVFVALLATDSGRLTAAELAEILQISPAAVSGGIRYLERLNLVTRERQPGSRREHYRVLDDLWYEAGATRDQLLDRWEDTAREGIEVLGRNTPAGERMAEAVAYLEFTNEELPKLLQRWHRRRKELGFG